MREFIQKSRRAEAGREQSREKREFEQRTGGRSDLEKMKLYNAEKLLLNLICEKEVFKTVKDELSPDDFSEGLHRRIAEIVFETLGKGEKINPAAVITLFDGSELGLVSEILSDDKNVDNRLEAVKMPLRIVLEHKRKKADEASVQGGDAAKLQEIMDRLKKEKK